MKAKANENWIKYFARFTLWDRRRNSKFSQSHTIRVFPSNDGVWKLFQKFHIKYLFLKLCEPSSRELLRMFLDILDSRRRLGHEYESTLRRRQKISKWATVFLIPENDQKMLCHHQHGWIQWNTWLFVFVFVGCVCASNYPAQPKPTLLLLL